MPLRTSRYARRCKCRLSSLMLCGMAGTSSKICFNISLEFACFNNLNRPVMTVYVSSRIASPVSLTFFDFLILVIALDGLFRFTFGLTSVCSVWTFVCCSWRCCFRSRWFCLRCWRCSSCCWCFLVVQTPVLLIGFQFFLYRSHIEAENFDKTWFENFTEAGNIDKIWFEKRLALGSYANRVDDPTTQPEKHETIVWNRDIMYHATWSICCYASWKTNQKAQHSVVHENIETI